LGRDRRQSNHAIGGKWKEPPFARVLIIDHNQINLRKADANLTEARSYFRFLDGYVMAALNEHDNQAERWKNGENIKQIAPSREYLPHLLHTVHTKRI
jgi:hypothetical protein